ncbi:hypothetical protein [Streptomyces tateyamensis]|uniref:hypothetical protein n=1 Tax=Streptomyces tateyamensis TaxID=565073 RepID=UPI0015E89407|nr:hypothetical protein [Streptomyces tateyamensis]
MRTLLPLALGAVVLALGAMFALAPSGSAADNSPMDGGTSVVAPQGTASPLSPSGGCC